MQKRGLNVRSCFWHYDSGWWSDGASMFGLATGIDYGVVFGAFAGAVFYVATAVNISRLKLVGYFITSFIFGVIGAPLLGSY